MTSWPRARALRRVRRSSIGTKARWPRWAGPPPWRGLANSKSPAGSPGWRGCSSTSFSSSASATNSPCFCSGLIPISLTNAVPESSPTCRKTVPAFEINLPAASRNLLLEPQRAQAEQRQAHRREHDEVEPEIPQARAAQHQRAFQFDVIRRRQHGADRVKNLRHRFARENKPGEKHRRQNGDHGHLQRLNLVRRARGDEQT